MPKGKSMYEELLTVLNRQKVRYLVVGGVAVNLYGIERMTGDFDIIIEMSPANLERFLDAAQLLKLKPSIPVKYKDITLESIAKWRREKDMIALRLIHSQNQMLILDLVFDDTVSFEEAFSLRETFRIGHISFPVMSINDLIKMKQGVAREQDIADVYHLKRRRDVDSDR